MNNFTGFVSGLWILLSRPPHLRSFSYWQLEESAGVRQHRQASFAGFKQTTMYSLFYSTANCSFFRAVSRLKHRLDSRNHTTGYRLFSYNRHPPSRVFWTVEGYIFIFSLFLNCPTKAMMFIYFFKLESSHALFLQHVRRPFNHKPESHHRMSHNINCCLCSNSYIENLKLLSAIYHVEALISKQTLQFHLAPTALEYI